MAAGLLRRLRTVQPASSAKISSRRAACPEIIRTFAPLAKALARRHGAASASTGRNRPRMQTAPPSRILLGGAALNPDNAIPRQLLVWSICDKVQTTATRYVTRRSREASFPVRRPALWHASKTLRRKFGSPVGDIAKSAFQVPRVHFLLARHHSQSLTHIETRKSAICSERRRVLDRLPGKATSALATREIQATPAYARLSRPAGPAG